MGMVLLLLPYTFIEPLLSRSVYVCLELRTVIQGVEETLGSDWFESLFKNVSWFISASLGVYSALSRI
jgi:hypothetical protein